MRLVAAAPTFCGFQWHGAERIVPIGVSSQNVVLAKPRFRRGL